MQIGIISDSHDRLPTLRWALDEMRRRELRTIIHPGDIIAPFAARLLADFDGEVHVVYGNNDGERAGLKKTLPQLVDGPLKLQLAGRNLLVHHFIDWCAAEDIAAADFVITGHTHEVSVEEKGGTVRVNPGECCGWVTGRATCGVLDLATSAFELIEVPT